MMMRMYKQNLLSNTRGFVLPVMIVLIVAGLAVFWGIYCRAQSDNALKKWTDEQALPVVSLVKPQIADALASMELPGRLDPYIDAPIYARVNGYLKRWYVDIGAHVHAGQLLAEIDTPDLDQQIMQAQADLNKAEANLSLATTTANRWHAMLGAESVSKQEVDEKSGDMASKQAMLSAAKANLNRLISTKAFARVLSPFDGIITARNIDNGALVIEGNSGKPLFEVSDNTRLRLYVNVPQYAANTITNGDIAEVTVPEHPNRVFTATVETSSKAIDTKSGSTLVQLRVENQSGSLLVGDYANVHFKGKSNSQSRWMIPASALIFDQHGLHVATVDAHNQISLKEVVVHRDLGQAIELASGVQAQDQIVEIPPDGLANGDKVRIAKGN